jgi:O-antigen/teichoic acid export membrane protein
MNGCSSTKTKTGIADGLKAPREHRHGEKRSRARVILKNSSALGLSTVVGKLFYFLLFILIGRYLGPSDLGKFTFALSFVAMFAVVNDLGLNILAVREVAKEEDLAGKYLGNIAAIKVVLGMVALALVMLFVNLMGYPQDNIRIVLLMGVAALLTAVSNGMRWVFQAYQRLEYESLVSVVQNILYFCLGFLAISLGLGVYGVGFSQIAVGILVVLFTWILLKKGFLKVKFEIDLDFWKKILRKSVPFALMLVFTGLYLNADTVLLSKFKGDQAVGLYNAANRLVLAGKMIPGVIIPALFPVMAEISRAGQSEFNNFLEKSSILMFSLALPVAVAITILAGKTIGLLYGAGFVGSVLCLQILVWGMFFMYISIVLGFGLIAKGKQKTNTVITGIGLGISLILNLLLIPGFGNIGTSIAVLSTEFSVLMMGLFFSRKYFGLRLSGVYPSVLKVILATSVMTIGIFLMKDLHLFLIVGVGGLIYLGSLFALRGLCGYDFYRLRELILAR